MHGLSRGTHRLAGFYDAVIVGSGYGGAISAARLAATGRRIGVLERGREWAPGDFPDSPLGAARQAQVRTGSRRWGPRDGLFDVRADAGATVLVGCGLGGTSLINAGVLMRPPASTFDDARWPSALRGDGAARLAPYLRRAESMLGATPYPRGWPPLSKVEALRRVGAALGHAVEEPPLAVSFRHGPNGVGVHQPACNLCGNCVTGCNHGAKSTLTTNYLPLAASYGAEIFTGVEVLMVQPADDGAWVVSYTGPDRMPTFVRAGVVVLAAGALGSTEILLRSRTAGLTTSPRLGAGFTGNGGGLAFAYAGDTRVAGWGWGGDRRPGGPVGPTIGGVIRVDDDLLIEEGAIPTALRAVTPWALAVRTLLSTDAAWPEVYSTLRRLVAHRERTLAFMLAGIDESPGRLHWRGGEVGIGLSGGVGEVRRSTRLPTLVRAAAGLGAQLVTAPFALPTRRLTVHPLGGCPMADRGAEGVVDDRGRVFRGDGAEVHDGLYVIDGATMPEPLNVNPLLTIAGLAERAVELLIQDRGWTAAAPGAAGHGRPAASASTGRGLRFTERLRGFLGRNVDGDPAAGCAQGRADGTTLECVLTLETDGPLSLGRPWRVTGTVVAPALAPRRLRVTHGSFRLAPGAGQRVRASYTLTLLADDGRAFELDGVKDVVVTDAAVWRTWKAATTLPVVVRDAGGVVVAAGSAGISAPDLARQLLTVRPPSRPAPPAAARRTVSLVGERRVLKVPPPQVRWCAGDGRWHEGDQVGPDAWLRLIRYPGRLGPVVLAGGFSMSSTSYLIDTIDTNLIEYLAARDYDIWLFDYRASIDLPSARSSFTIDDIATRDWPAAVAEVRRVTGADSVQAVGHCVGSLTLMMALAAGMSGVRSAVCMQMMLHPVVSSLNLAKATLRIGGVLQTLGVHRVAPLRGGLSGAVSRTLLRAVPAPPAEQCGRAVCTWVNAIYGSTHRHAQLNDATHELLDDLFDVADVTALRHLSRIARGRGATDAAGADRYLSHPERLSLPLLLVQGECNDIFRPEGSLRTWQWLSSANDPTLYERVVLPGYAHLDALIGDRAAVDVYPVIAGHLDRFASASGR